MFERARGYRGPGLKSVGGCTTEKRTEAASQLRCRQVGVVSLAKHSPSVDHPCNAFPRQKNRARIKMSAPPPVAALSASRNGRPDCLMRFLRLFIFYAPIDAGGDTCQRRRACVNAIHRGAGWIGAALCTSVFACAFVW